MQQYRLSVDRIQYLAEKNVEVLVRTWDKRQRCILREKISHILAYMSKLIVSREEVVTYSKQGDASVLHFRSHLEYQVQFCTFHYKTDTDIKE